MPTFRPLLAALVAASLGLSGPALAAPAEPVGAFHGGPFERLLSVSIKNLALKDALQLLAAKGRLNLVIEDDLKTVISVEFRDVRLGDALEALLAIGGLQAIGQGNVYAIVGRRRAFERGLLSANAQVFRLRYASASRVAEFLNNAALTRPYTGTSSGGSISGQNQNNLEIAKADPHSNSVFVIGTPSDLALAQRAIAAMDQPTKDRVFKLSHANAVQVASLLNATIFNSGNKGLTTEPLRADVETLTEGTDGGSVRAGVELNDVRANIRTATLQSQTLNIESKYAVAVPDTRTNSVIVTGSQETLGLAADFINQVDRKLKQVAIEVQLVEVSSQDALSLGTTYGGTVNSVNSTFDPRATTDPGWTVAYDPATFNPLTFRAKLNALVTDQRAKVLAHPTIIASDNTESQINIIDEVIKGTRITNQGLNVGNQALLLVEPIYGAAGVTLNILPRIGADGMVTLRLHPAVSSIRETQRDSANNLISLLSRRELVAQKVVVPSGGTLMIGGLTQTATISTRRKFPILGDIPLLGHLFGNTERSERQTELIITVTPKVLPD